MWQLELRTGDRVLLCSDGLTNEVGSDEMAHILGEVEDPSEAAQRLVDAANGHGGADNITVVIVDVQVGEEGGEGASTVTALRLGAAALAGSLATTAAVPAVEPVPDDAAARRRSGRRQSGRRRASHGGGAQRGRPGCGLVRRHSDGARRRTRRHAGARVEARVR